MCGKGEKFGLKNREKSKKGESATVITGIIAAFLVFIILPVTLNNGETGPAILVVVIAILALICGAISRAQDRAYNNRMWYWAKSGKDRARARLRWEEEARAEAKRKCEVWAMEEKANRALEEYRRESGTGEKVVRTEEPFISETLRARNGSVRNPELRKKLEEIKRRRAEEERHGRPSVSRSEMTRMFQTHNIGSDEE